MLNWVEVRGVRWVELESDAISFKDGEHKLCSVYDYRRGILECPREQEGANGAVDLGRHGQWLIRSLASRGLEGLAGSPRSNPIPSTLPDIGFWAGYRIFSISS